MKYKGFPNKFRLNTYGELQYYGKIIKEDVLIEFD
jgi:hypothetical protein